MIRPFVLLDLPALRRYRQRGLFLDTTTALTWGPTLVPAGALLSYLAPATGIFTYLGTPDGDEQNLVIVQLVHPANASCARFSFLAPRSALDTEAFHQMVEYVATQVGERGAHNLVAEVDEGTQAYETLRRAGFAIYGRQRIWKLDGLPDLQGASTTWRRVRQQDGPSLRGLYNALVPALAQQVDSPLWDRLRGLVYRQEGELLAFVELNYGPRGIKAHPFVHPDTEQITARLVDLVAKIPNRRSRPLYFCVRSYQGWLESPLEALGAQPGARQAVMVKRLTASVKQPARAPLPALKRTTANPTVSFARSFASLPHENPAGPEPSSEQR